MLLANKGTHKQIRAVVIIRMFVMCLRRKRMRKISLEFIFTNPCVNSLHHAPVTSKQVLLLVKYTLMDLIRTFSDNIARADWHCLKRSVTN